MAAEDVRTRPEDNILLRRKSCRQEISNHGRQRLSASIQDLKRPSNSRRAAPTSTVLRLYCHTHLPLPVSATKYDRSTNCAMLSRRVQLSSTAGWWGELAQSHKPPETVPLSNRSFLQLGHRSTAKCRGTCILCAISASPDWDATIKVPTTLAPKTSPH